MIRKQRTRVKVVGGIGNQLFGFFFGALVSKKLQTSLVLDTRLIKFGSNKERRSIFQEINTSSQTFEIIDSSMINEIPLKYIDFYRKIYWKLINYFSRTISEQEYKSPGFKFNVNQSYSGYFQNWFYADELIKTVPELDLMPLKKSIRFSEELELLLIQNPICVHLREGDYLNFPDIYRLIPVEYFEYCLKQELSRNSRRPIWIFTEDASSLKFYSDDFVNLASRVIDRSVGLTDLESFMLMAKSKTLIATNSTYSLWASWFVWKNGHTAYVPFQSYIFGVSNDLMDERWNRYDFEKDIFYPGKFNQERYNQLEREFLSKFPK
jgi:hypothetical protein